jgi:L-alanine-DL-glutamate epimerase-like enolase superfamily enzyme
MEAIKTAEAQQNEGLVFSSMLIEKVELFKLDIPLKQPFIISLGPIYSSKNVIVKIYTNNGLVGIGECSPYAYIVGETQESEIAIGKMIGKLLIGKNPLEIHNRLLEIDTAIAFNKTIKSAFDMALYDLASKYCKLPLYAFLGGSRNKKLISDMTVGINKPEKMAADALSYKQAGFTILKVKLGADQATDVARIAAIRMAVGDDITIRIDANQAWDSILAIKILAALAPYNIQHCEEPVARWDNAGMKKVCKNSSIPIMADESLFDHHDAFRLASTASCDLFNIKLSKSGGIYKALKIIAIAEASGIKSQVGSMGESRYGITALAHLALASNNIIHFDFDAPLMQSEDPVIGGLQYGEGGEVTISDAHGIGADFNPDYYEQVPL